MVCLFFFEKKVAAKQTKLACWILKARVAIEKTRCLVTLHIHICILHTYMYMHRHVCMHAIVLYRIVLSCMALHCALFALFGKYARKYFYNFRLHKHRSRNSKYFNKVPEEKQSSKSRV